MIVEVFGQQKEIDGSRVEESEEEIRKQVNQYLEGKRASFDLSVSFPESFTGKVMREMQGIPRGETRTYGEIAEKLDSAAVAVGQACKNNPLPIVIPCHRAVCEDSTGGYGGEKDSEIKKKLLELED